MSENEGPLDLIPTVNYPPLLTNANYLSTKQMIDQVVSEDQEYVSWKLKSMRTGGTMNSYMQDFLRKTKENNNLPMDSSAEDHSPSEDEINHVPRNICFPRDFYEEALQKVPRPREISQDEQFKLLVTNLDEQQTNRFEVFHRTSLNKTQVKKIAGMVINQSVTENIRVFLQAIGKLYAGEIIELALDVRQKWLDGRMMIEFDRRKSVAKRLKKYLKKLTKFVEGSNDDHEDSVDETESDLYFDDEEDQMVLVEQGNKLLKSEKNSPEIRLGLINQYNKLVKEFNTIDVSVEKYANSPILPEHIREAWRLYQLQSDTLPAAQWRTQGEGNGWMFR
ncbi:TATA-binding protein-associated factor TAF11 TDEL_0A04090 [Torulaspora delbrueckii]|uniref:TAFII28-like protein domain-containing protein n=1 Tax=Torulaspora delbrueckii TaxID=4950 RepID=G8ZM97_TORDE|nr:hypothetical protein TDEL_0A04090 [Torulaspora delbrueckii]CCE89741.1 hypothetical protein TDEL_0A04090 [Torulaspora delbrueckii]